MAGVRTQGSGSIAALCFVEAAVQFSSDLYDSASARIRWCGEEAVFVPAVRAGGFLEAGGPKSEFRALALYPGTVRRAGSSRSIRALKAMEMRSPSP